MFDLYHQLGLSLNKAENLQKRALRFLHNYYSSSYKELFKKVRKKHRVRFDYRSLCIEIFKTLNDVNPSFIKDIFQLRMTNCTIREKYELNLEISKSYQVRFGTNSLIYLGPKVWNSFPYHLKPSENLTIFKTLTKNLNGTVCICKICKR